MTDAAPTGSQPAPPGGRRITFEYLAALLVGALGLVTVFALVLLVLDRSGNLPPPQIANNLCIDEKLRFMRDSRRFAASDFKPDVMVVGSSVSWRHFDGEAVEQATGGAARVFNAGFCALNMKETLFATRYFLQRYPSVREVVTILAPQDLTNCQGMPSAFFAPEVVDAYVYGDAWVFPIYLQYFDPFTFAKNVYLLATNEVFRWAPAFDRFGGLPIATRELQTRLIYGTLPPYGPTCFHALRTLALELKASGRRLVVATMPMHPAWLDRYDAERRRMRELDAGIDIALAGTGAELWRSRNFALKADDFVDAIHIRWSAAQAFSRALAQETGLGWAVVRHPAPGASPVSLRTPD